MELFFLICFIFGALFAVATWLLGVAHFGLPGAHVGHIGPVGHVGHVGNVGGTQQMPGPAGHGAILGQSGGTGPATGHAGSDITAPGFGLPLFNVTAVLAFLTWFGAAGYLLVRFTPWPLLLALVLAVVVGSAGAVLIALFLRKLLEGERVMDPRDYRLEGTIAHVTVTIPEGGTGEIVFTKAGGRRSEAARSTTGRAIARETEVVILDYARGIARVEPWEDLVERKQLTPPDEPVAARPHQTKSTPAER